MQTSRSFFIKVIITVLLSVNMLNSVAFADAAPGDIIITLGEDLTEAQKNTLLQEMDAPENSETITVTNEEEHHYLGDYISAAQIGSKALSSTKITIGESNSGLIIETNHINWVTKEMYANALTTAGVKDANIYITAPFTVSGTAALTGIIKAYELTADVAISEEKKQVANEEMVKTAKLADHIGADKATELMTKIKEDIAKNKPESEEELRTLIKQAANELGITLTDQELEGLVSLFNKMQELDIDWNKINNELQKARENIKNFLNSEEGQSILQKLKRFFADLFEAIGSLFQ